MKKENKQITDVDGAMEQLKDVSPDLEIYGRIYRITSPVDSVGRPSSEFVGKVNEIVDEDYIGRMFGPGTYRIHYRIKDQQNTDERDVKFNIGQEYAKKTDTAPAVEVPQVLGGLNLNGILSGLTLEKITAIGAAVKMIRDFLAPPPPPPPVDLTKLLEIMATSNKQQNVSDAVLIQAMQSLQKQNAQPSLLQQVRELKEVKDALQDDAENIDGEGGQMNSLIELAFKYLPQLLAAKQNNFQAVGQTVRENPMVSGLIQDNPDLAQQFFNRAAATYGAENARQLAAGFGYQITPAQQSEQEEEHAEG